MTTLEGIDVSVFQGHVDMHAVKLAGKHFVLCKASEGTYDRDETFPANWRHAREQGLRRIAYHFLNPDESPQDQVNYCHEYVRNNGHFRPGDGMVVDVEEYFTATPEVWLEAVTSFIEAAKHDLGRNCGVYTNPNTWLNIMGNPTNKVLSSAFLWLADLGPYIPKLAPWPNGLSFLQYSFTGHVPGIEGAVDLDRFYGTPQQLLRVLR